MIISVKYMWKGRSIFILIPPRLPYGWVSTADEPLGIHFQREGVRKFFSNGSDKNMRWYESARPERGRGGAGVGIKLTFTIWGIIKLSEWVILYIGKRNIRWTNHTMSPEQ